jgi:hypothetical protein
VVVSILEGRSQLGFSVVLIVNPNIRGRRALLKVDPDLVLELQVLSIAREARCKDSSLCRYRQV